MRTSQNLGGQSSVPQLSSGIAYDTTIPPCLLVQATGPPTFVPELSTGFPQITSPFREHGVLEFHEVAVLGVHGVGKPPRKLPAFDLWLIRVGRNDGQWKDRRSG